jgi:hypothetical protein
MKFAFLTFGGGGENYYGAVERICRQAKTFSLFKKIYGFTDKDLKNDKEWWNKHANFVSNNKRGYGYWIWKCYLIKKVMQDMEMGDIILYTDSGCELNIKGRPRMFEYIKLVMKNDTLAMKICFPEKQYTKMDLMHSIKCPQEHIDDGQVEAMIIFLKKTEKNMRILDEIIELYERDNYHFVDDTPSVIENDKIFKEHRHDQSIFSLIFKKYDCFTIPDETYFEPDWQKGFKYPILAVRNRGPISCFGL